MEGQGPRDRYGNPARQQQQQQQQSYPQGYSSLHGQNFQGGYPQSRGSQSQLSGQAQSYGTHQASTQRPGSSSYAYGSSMNQQFGYGDFAQDPARQSYPSIIGYPYQTPQPGYELNSRTYQPMQSQPFPEYYEPSAYTAAPSTPSQLQYNAPSGYVQPPRPRTGGPSPYGSMSTYTGFDGASSMQPPSVQPQQQQSETSRPNDGYRMYFGRLRETFDHIQAGRLAQGGQSLLDTSEALLARVDELGLTRDDENLHDQRLKMWKDFNMCWLAFMQRLKDALELAVQAGQQPSRPKSIITPAFLDKMADKLIAWADAIEKWGLVDYETGVWEEEILEVAGDCRSIFESNSELFSASALQQNQP